jgi:PAS domain-containing protein
VVDVETVPIVDGDTSERAETKTRLRGPDDVDVTLDVTGLGECHVLAYARDISARVAAGRRLTESEARYRSVTDALDTPEACTTILNDEFRVVWVSGAINEFFDFEEGGLVGLDKMSQIRSELKHISEDSDGLEETVVPNDETNDHFELFTCHVLLDEGHEERWICHWSPPD